MNDHDINFERLNSIFSGDGEELRQQFIFAGLLLTIFERFKTYVVDRVDGFFSSHAEIKGGKLSFIRSKKFKDLIKEKGSGRPGQHANKDFRAALHWFYECDAIDAEEFNEIERLYKLRNEIGHELLLIVADDKKSPITLFDVIFAFGLYVKIVRWWIKEVEVATDPDMTEEQYSSIEWDGVESMDTILLREILNKTLSNNKEWNDLLEATKEYTQQV